MPNLYLRSSYCILITTHNKVATRLCFYTCLRFCSQVGLCPSMHHRSHDQGVCPGGSLSRRVSVQRGLCPDGSLSRGSLCQGDPQTENPLYSNAWVVCILLECILVLLNSLVATLVALPFSRYPHLFWSRFSINISEPNRKIVLSDLLI